MMNQKIKHISLIVDDYDVAIDFYTRKLNFLVIEDIVLDENKRWVLIAPNKFSEFSLLLAKASSEKQKSFIGNQSGGRVFLFLNTTNFEKDHKNLIQNNITIVREPKNETYGKVLVFEDCYGNLWDLIEPSQNVNENFYTTGILKLKDPKTIEKAKKALLELQKHTLNEKGNLIYTIQQCKENPNEFIIWESFVSQNDFFSHLNSAHLKIFLELDLFQFIKGYETKVIQ
jgi:quinol monooxygenase YgiN/predicted enzyme related to lactoylglutathione lyase